MMTKTGIQATLILIMGWCSPGSSALAQSHPYQLSEVLHKPALFAPGIVSTDALEYGITFSPDGKTIYFTRRASWRDNPAIYVASFQDGVWQEPEIVAFSGTYSDEYPALTPDGSRLYFASNRPVDNSTPLPHNDIWFVEKTNEGWGEPQHVAAPISTEHIDSHPYVLDDRTILFHSNRAEGSRNVDIYQARFEQGRYSDPTPMPFNSEATDGEACLDPDGRFVIFYSERAGMRGAGNLFIVHRENGEWSSVSNLGDLINTAEYEWTPALSPDGRYLFYAHLAGADSDIYQIDLEVLLKSR